MRFLAAGLLTLCLAFPLAGCEPVGKNQNEGAESAVPAAGETTTVGGGGAAVDPGDVTSADAVTSALGSDASTNSTDAVSDTTNAAGEVIAKVNGEPILLSEFQVQAFDAQRYFVSQGNIDPSTEDGQNQLLYLRRSVLDDMINQKLIEQAAKDLKIEVTDAEIQQAIEQTAKDVGGQEKLDQSRLESGSTPEEVAEAERSGMLGRKVLDQVTQSVPTTAEFRHARHILCTTAADCQKALDRLTAGEAFDTVAKAISIDQATKARGGDLDWMSRDMLPSPELADAIFQLKAGERSGVVTSSFGFHVIEVSEVDPARKLSDEQRSKLREKAVFDWLTKQRKASEVDIFIEDLKPIPTP